MSYPDYKTFLRYKNCCRPIGDTGPPGPAGPTGPAATLDVRGSKGEILYFSETDNLLSTDNVFIQEANVTINNNLVVTGNLSTNNQFINDVSGIYFSDGTYIGHGTSFDITTSERLDISAAGGVTVNGNLLVKDAATFQSDTMITGNLNIDGATTIDNTLEVNGNVIINGNLSMNDNFINDVSGIYFSDGTYIAHGSSFDITTSERLDISAAGGITLNGNLLVKDAATFQSDTTINGNLNIDGPTTIDNTLTIVSTNVINGNLIFGPTERISSSGSTTVINSGGLTIDAATTINGNLSMNNNFINDVSGIIFTQGNLLFSDFSSSTQQVQLPSSQGQPISLERKTLFYDDNFNINTGGSPIDISFVVPNFNQLGLTISGSGNTIISPSLDISGQYVEMYANFLVNSTSGASKTIALDISGVSPGSSFNETIDVRSISKQGSFYITFGPHIFTPEQWADTSDFVITANTSDTLDINKYKLMFKSYFM